MINNESIAQLYKTYYYPLYCHAESIVGKKEAAEDIVSDLFLKLLEKQEIIHVGTSLKVYLYKSVRNNCLDHLTHIKVVRKHIEYTLNMADNIDWLQIRDSNNPLFMIILQEIERKIEKTIKVLPAQCKVVFELWEEGLSYKDIAERLDISVGIISKQISRAKAKFQKVVDDIG